MKQYKLVYLINNESTVSQTIITGSLSLCNYKKSELSKTNNYKLGKLKVISENGLKYHIKHKY